MYFQPDHGNKALVGELLIANIGILDSSSSSAARPVDISVDSIDFTAIRGTISSAWKSRALDVEVDCGVDSTLNVYYLLPVPMPSIRHTFKQSIALSAVSGPTRPTGVIQQTEAHLRGNTAQNTSVDADASAAADLVDVVYARPPERTAHSFHQWTEGKQYVSSAAGLWDSLINAIASVKVADEAIIVPVHYHLTTNSALLPESVDEAIVHVPAICYYIGEDLSSVQWNICADSFDIDLTAAEIALDTTLTITCANLDPAAETSHCGALLPYLVMRNDFLKTGKFVIAADAEKGGRQPSFPELLLGTQHQSSVAVTTKSMDSNMASLSQHSHV